jgi:proteic killer suppression protein
MKNRRGMKLLFCVALHGTEPYLSHKMILGFRDQNTERLWRGEFVRRFQGIRRQALMRLGRLEAATRLGDLAGLSGNRLGALSGNRQGQWGIRVNDQWHICFEWQQGALRPSNVEIVDYH